MDRETFQKDYKRQVYLENNTQYYLAMSRLKRTVERNLQRIKTYESEIPKIRTYEEKMKASGEDDSAVEAARHLLKLEQEVIEKSRKEHHINILEIEALTILSGLSARD